MFSTEERVAMATRCRDCDAVPKVPDAGAVFEMPDGRRVQIMHNGLRVIADGYYGQWMTDLIRLCRGHHETQEERLFHEVVKRLPADATMIELGGFWAYYSLWFLMNQPERRAVVIEPEPIHLAIGQENAALNGLSPEFKLGFAGGTYASDLPFHAEKSGPIQLPRYSVEHLMQEQGWTSLTLLHADIQGAETEMLESCREMFRAGRIDWVFVSTHAHQISNDPLTHQRCLAILRDCGGVIEAEHDVHESFSGDGLIVARFCPAPRDWVPVSLSSNRASQSLFRHLAYDLHESGQAVAQMQGELEDRSSAPASLHNSLRPSGILYTLEADGPLGTSGDTLLLPDDKVISAAVREAGAWDIEDVEAFASRMAPDRRYTLVDIGANIGLFSRQLVRRSEQIDEIICIEPEAGNFKALRYNLDAVKPQAALFNLALGSANGESQFFRDSDNIGNYSLNSDAMRDRPFDSVTVPVRETRFWMTERLRDAAAILWKSDTQGSDEVIVSGTPMEIWERVDVALMEMWRIAKPDFDRDAFRERIESFPNRQLGSVGGVTASEILDYLRAEDWQFQNLLLWR
jgi:FkbM family methyltransferase